MQRCDDWRADYFFTKFRLEKHETKFGLLLCVTLRILSNPWAKLLIPKERRVLLQLNISGNHVTSVTRYFVYFLPSELRAGDTRQHRQRE